MSWLIFEASTWTNYGFVLLYLEEAIRLRSMWMMIVSMYYGSIALLRTHWSHFTKMINTLTNEVEKKQLRINGVRSVGLMLVGLNLIFGIFVSLVTHGEGSFRYSQGVFYLMILYVGFGFLNKCNSRSWNWNDVEQFENDQSFCRNHRCIYFDCRIL